MNTKKITIAQFPTPNMEHVDITPTLGNQRMLANMVLESKYRDCWEVEPYVFNWALGVMKSDDLENDEYIESFRTFKAIVASYARSMILAIADNNFELLTEIPIELETQFRLIHAYTQAVPGINTLWGELENLNRELSARIKNLLPTVLDEWANAHIDDPCPIKRKHAREIHHEELMHLLTQFNKHN